mmetsp:Transcript_6596/g.14424  ORF Transcript_6596/g.14424 Transcript_6596/m.14424 type:complete len:99 (+) Transcript_6596:81-377(+)
MVQAHSRPRDISLWSTEDLRQLGAMKAELIGRLEAEIEALKAPSDLELRVEALEGAVRCVQQSGGSDVSALRTLVEDLLDPHATVSQSNRFGSQPPQG